MCRDLKGLFTPCPKELNKEAAARLEARTLHQWAHRKRVAPELKADPQTVVVNGRPPSESAPLPFVAGVTASDPGRRRVVKLCHDLKGLFTPCPK